MCEAGWHHCVSCGWDLTRLIDEAEENRLQAIAHASVGVVVGGRRNRFASALPFGGPNLYVTNARVLIGADEGLLRVRTSNNMEYHASIVGYDLPSGVGLLKADIPFSEPIEPAKAPPALSDSCWAVCFPVVFEDDIVRYLPVSLHRGHLTASGQTGTFLVSFENLLRTDHSIEDGCTGGPLIDSQGRIAGMILGSPEDGITYALPLDGLAPMVRAMSRNEQPPRPYFGIGLVTPDERRRAKFGIDDRPDHPLIAYLIPGSPAAQAGVRPGDLLVAIGGNPVASVREAGTRLLESATAPPGVALTLLRGGKQTQVTVQPVKRPERVLLDPIDELQEALEVNLKEVSTGPGAQQGLVVSDLVRGGRGEKSRYKNGDMIVAVDKKSVRSFEGYDDVIRTRHKEIFGESAAAGKQFASTYLVNLEVRAEGKDKVTREYVNLFPDLLAPPVY
jgi:S1-C subfamily serine protease